MSSQSAPDVIGYGSPQTQLSPDEMRAIVERALRAIPAQARVLVIIPDKTRDDNTDTLFPFVAEILTERGVAAFDALVAQGTHVPMTEEEKRAKIGGPLANNFTGHIFDHRWDTASELVTLGELSAAQVSALTDGAYRQPIPVTINKLLAGDTYDTVLVMSATVPHEVAGYAGGAKYFFPGVAGPDVTNATHWVGALSTVEHTIGRVETPVRRVIEAASDLIPLRIITFNSVVTRNDERGLQTHALFAGDFRRAFRLAAEVSRTVHIKYTGRKYKRVVALLDEHYDEMWVGGKASYRLGGIIEEGGELIIYAPHLHSISQTHGYLIEKYGYAPLEVVREWLTDSRELRENLCVAAHLTHVAYAGRLNEAGEIVPRYQITLASQVDAETCRRVKVNYLDYRTFDLQAWVNDPDTLTVERAGRDLYLVAPLED